ncbi:MAG: alcohol dehydrogenase [Planctomycetota bacterium]|nr:MAG: alcohol dehydrogenase [Planctomycetota bacterium]
MKAVVIHEHGEYDVLRVQDIAAPEPGPGEVQLEVRAIGLNHLDTWVRRGVPGHAFPLPMTPGCDFSGTVSKLGPGVTGLSIGDRVFAAPGISCGRCAKCASGNDHLCRHYGILGETTNGGCAEFAVLPAQNALPIPGDLDFVQAAAFPLTFLTAWHMLVARCGLTANDNVLVHAAGSGVGSAAVQIAKFHGARVLATAGSDEKLAKATELGADAVCNYNSDDFVAAAKAFSKRAGMDIVFEHVGEATMPGSLRTLAKGGRVVTCGATTGPKLEADLRHVFFKSLSILGSTMGSRGELHLIAGLVGQGLLKPVIDRVLPLDQVAEAHAAMAGREQFGKIVLVNGEPS